MISQVCYNICGKKNELREVENVKFEQRILLIYAFHVTKFYATSESTSNFRQVMRQSLSHNSTASN